MLFGPVEQKNNLKKAMKSKLDSILQFDNKKIDSSIINDEQIMHIVKNLLKVIENNIEGDVVEFGCYVGESSKYLMKTLIEHNSEKNLYVYDSFEGLPPLSKWEENTGWKEGTLKSTEEILKSNFEQNGIPIPIIHKNWFKDIPDNNIPEKISFAFLDGDFYDSIYDSLDKIYDKMSDGGIILFHDFRRPDLPGVDAAIIDFFKKRNITYNLDVVCNQLGRHYVGIKNKSLNKKNITLVTGIWDIKRSELSEGWNRSFEHYLINFEKLLKCPNNMIIFIEEKYVDFVWEHRQQNNTIVIVRETEWFKSNEEIYNNIQKIRNNSDWYNQVGWLKESTQAKLEMYNPLVMSKMFLLNDATILDPFNSSHLVWVDGGITNTVHEGYFWKDNVIDKLSNHLDKFSFVCFPYDGKQEIHGFKYEEMCRYSNNEVNKVARGGIFGGPKKSISDINSIYYNLLLDTLSNGLMGTEESIFTIILYKYPELINYFEIENNGLLGTFFENIKNDKLISISEKNNTKLNMNIDNVGLYVITFNSPNQFKTLIDSFLEYDRNYLDKPKKYLLNNSTDESTTDLYQKLCDEYGFEHIKKENLGICGGRQWIAEHFDQSELDYYLFFEDDMFFYPKSGFVCKNGFNRYVPDLYYKSLEIINIEGLDFLKLNFSEFFGDNSTQWAWYNVPQTVREMFWPEKPKLPEHGLDPNPPKVKYDMIKSYKGVPYTTGEIYYCNWPQIVSRHGNKKMFLETKWAHPFEQTWMSYIYQETKKGNIKPGILLLTPTEHNRFDHYDKKLRKES